MTTAIQFTVGQSIYTRAQFDWYQITTFQVIGRDNEHVTLRDQFGEITRVPVRVTTVHNDIVTEAVDLGNYKHSTTLYATMKTEDIAS